MSRFHKLVKREYLLPFVLVTSLFFLWGFAHAILDVLNIHFQDQLHITRAQSAKVQLMFYLGYFIMALPAGFYISKHGYRSGVILGLLLYGIGSLLFYPGQWLMSFNFFLFSLFVIACGLVFLETAANPYVTELGDHQTAASRLNLAQSFNGFGCICAPFLTSLVLFKEGNQEQGIAMPYVTMGLIVLSICLVFCKVQLPHISYTESNDLSTSAEMPRSGFGRLIQNKLFLFGLFALFCYEIAEISINSFFINYVVEDYPFDEQLASAILSFGGLGLFMLGRLTGTWVMSLIKAETVLFCCAMGTIATTALVVLNLGMVSFVSLILIYAFEAIMFPTIFALSLRGLHQNTKLASSLLMMSPIGGAVGPLMMGYVADQYNMSWSFIVPLLAFVVVGAYSICLKTRSTVRPGKEL